MLPLYPSESVNNKQTLMSDLPQAIGTEGARRFPTKPNARDAIWDSNENYIYVRVTDLTGNVISINRLKYEDAPEPKMEDIFVTKDAFNELRNELMGGLSDVKQYISETINAAAISNAANVSAEPDGSNSKQLSNPGNGGFNQNKEHGKGNGVGK